MFQLDFIAGEDCSESGTGMYYDAETNEAGMCRDYEKMPFQVRISPFRGLATKLSGYRFHLYCLGWSKNLKTSSASFAEV